ncbi:DUF6922 domain-containing protein [Dyadobacter arcticus]|uniref:DUF6922 domain-containing protein n=1 Tax=Dyadobacter arcticus TaxID=1078754 RepID=A0ABX0ULE6_9BACT|nr:hypothetical protein [Dyadobacter arcticus]NIJ53727.1 hypothetical protein [Dyadobacter arcticus]
MGNLVKDCPDISQIAFWDVDFSKIDFRKNDLFVMEKVANYGSWTDFIETVRFYGTDLFKQKIIGSAYLKKDVLNFLCVVFELDQNDFTCYTRRQSPNLPWKY